LGLPQAVLGRVVGLAALEDEAARLGLSVGDATVSAQILEIPAFLGVDGTFDREGYRFVLEQSGLSVAEFEARVRAETAANLVQTAVSAGVAFPSVFADRLYAHARESRDVTWARLGPGDLETIVPEPSEAQIVQFHGENPALFTAPETRVITYAWLTPDMMLDTIPPTRRRCAGSTRSGSRTSCSPNGGSWNGWSSPTSRRRRRRSRGSRRARPISTRSWPSAGSRLPISTSAMCARPISAMRERGSSRWTNPGSRGPCPRRSGLRSSG
jgi:hypothetical protein